MGYLRSRGALRVAVIVRECPFILIKLSKFNSLITFCSICPINWMYCSKIDAQRLVISLHSRLILTEPLITSYLALYFLNKNFIFRPECTCVRGFSEWHCFRSGEVCKSLFSEIGMMLPKDSYGRAFDNEICRTGHIYPAMVQNTLWAFCTDETTKKCKMYFRLFHILFVL